MNWIDHKSYIEICPPKDFNFSECLVHLSRSHLELMHQIRGGYLYKLIKVDEEMILLKIGSSPKGIQVEFPVSPLFKRAREKVAAYIWEWFDLEQDISNFYEVAGQDKVLRQLAYKYYGLRIMCIPDLFEALTWAIIGQQINLPFAYTLKKRFIEQFGEGLTFEDGTFWLFPAFEKIANINVEDLRRLQFTGRKAEYVIGVAKSMMNGELTKENLLQKHDDQQIKKSLMKIKGIGPWTADYVMMKCLHLPSAFPITDVGLQNALKLQLGLERKPTIDEMKEMAKNWGEWQAYATFYLWRSLYD